MNIYNVFVMNKLVRKGKSHTRIITYSEFSHKTRRSNFERKDFIFMIVIHHHRLVNTYYTSRCIRSECI